MARLRAAPITPGVFSSLKKTSRVASLDASYDDVSGNVSFTNEEEGEFSLLLSRVGTLAQRIPALTYTTLAAEPLHALMNIFLNQQVRGGRAKSPRQIVNDLSIFLASRQ